MTFKDRLERERSSSQRTMTGGARGVVKPGCGFLPAVSSVGGPFECYCQAGTEHRISIGRVCAKWLIY